jgi:hypothetical protein
VDTKRKASVRKRARFRCEYCCFPEGVAELPFQIDHVLPRKHGGSSELGNLALTCFRCNSYKGTNLSGIDPGSMKVIRLFNPRKDVWAEHFRWKGVAIIGRTAVGRATIGVLRMNRPDVLLLRRSLIMEGVTFK